MAKFVAATLRDKVMQEVNEENEALRARIELLEGVPKMKLFNTKTGYCYGKGKFRPDDCFDDDFDDFDDDDDNVYFLSAFELRVKPAMPLYWLLGSPHHITISGRFWGTLEASRVIGAIWGPDGNVAFGAVPPNDSSIKRIWISLKSKGVDDALRQKYSSFTGHDATVDTNVSMDKPVADLLAVYGKQEVTSISVFVDTVDMLMRRPNSRNTGSRN